MPPLLVWGPQSPVSLRYDISVPLPVRACEGPGCQNPVGAMGTGRPGRFCSTACRVRAHRRRQADRAPVTVEVDMGSATSRGRPPDRAWLVRLRRGERSVIVSYGLRRPAADRLAEQLADLLS
jgi:hypothetical protein